MTRKHVIVIGAGVGGLVAAIDLARNGMQVEVFEKAQAPGGKMREIEIAGAKIDSGPTVFTMRWVFEKLFQDAGKSLTEYLTLHPAHILARHSWPDGARLDLFADQNKSIEAISEFADTKNADGYLQLTKDAAQIYDTLEKSFILAPNPTMPSLVMSSGLQGLRSLKRTSPFTPFWKALEKYFNDKRLQQLFGRYATYCGSSPFEAPATLLLIAHVEQQGVWFVEGGMARFAEALMQLGKDLGVRYHFNQEIAAVSLSGGQVNKVTVSSGKDFDTKIILANSDISAFERGAFGPEVQNAVDAVKPAQRSLSAVTISMLAKTEGFPLAHHNVFFSSAYRAEFEDIFKQHRLPLEPTVYICAQDRGNMGASKNQSPDEERLFFIINAPALGDKNSFTATDFKSYVLNVIAQLKQQHGLHITFDPRHIKITTPNDFEQMFPATGGALYGQATHGWAASFQRPKARTKIPGLYIAGGSAHPSAGVPMAAVSGRLAAQQILEDYQRP